MPFLPETVRLIEKEEELVNDTSTYNSPAEVDHDWTTRATKNIVLVTASIVYIKWVMDPCSAHGASRVLANGVPVVSTGAYGDGGTLRKIYLILAAGNYSIEFQTAMWWHAGSGHMSIYDIFIATLDFSDRNTDYTNISGSASIADGANADIINQNITVPLARKLAVGAIKKVTVIITAICYADDNRENEMLNVGESTTAGRSGFKISVDDAQENWDDKRVDFDAETGYPTYGEGSFGRLIYVADAGDTINVKVNAENLPGGALIHRAYLQVVMCPWIIPNEEYEPLALDFAQGSTLYLKTEPLESNPTKSVKIGKKRFVSFGDSTDYYYLHSGVDILESSYTFESVAVSKVLLFVSGYGGCISFIGVDIR